MNDRILRALRREPVDRTPVWFMRQAGRSLPRYREIRKEHDFQEILERPERIAEVTALPLEYYEVDAAILFMDLSTPFPPAGLAVEFVPGVGPVPDRTLADGLRAGELRRFDPRDDLGAVLEGIRLVKRSLPVPLIGFVGAPFTLCSYLVRGRTRERRLHTLRAFLWREPAAWAELAAYWTDALAEFALAQREAGADAIQVFDSWAGVLGPDEYEARALPHSRRLLDRLARAGIPTVHFVAGNPAILPLAAAAGGDALGVDWLLPLDEAWEAVGPDRAIQGNLDPATLLAGEEVAAARARDVLARAAGRPGHIFNLGHGVPPEADPRVIGRVVREVHAAAPSPGGG